MRYREEANKIIVAAEASLRSLAEQALAERAYGDVAHIASIADSLQELSDRTDIGSEASSHVRLHNAPADSVAATRRKYQRSKGSNHANRNYPRFERDGDKLVKVGWSKKSREEYEHRARRSVVLAFSNHLGARTVKGRTFVIEELLPVHDASGKQLPSYQVYLALAWLRQVGAVEKKGRDGYLRATDPLDTSVFDRLWDQIPEQS